MAENLPTVDGDNSPIIDGATFADMSGFHGLTPEALWEVVGDTGDGSIAPWALVEANRLADTGVTAKAAFLAGVGWLLEAQRRQERRNTDKARVLAAFQGLLASETEIPTIPADHT